jgi:hypothetical protein
MRAARRLLDTTGQAARELGAAEERLQQLEREKAEANCEVRAGPSAALDRHSMLRSGPPRRSC